MKVLRANIILLLLPFLGTAQKVGEDSIPKIKVMDANPSIISNDGEMWLQSGICKPLKWEKLEKANMLPVMNDSHNPRFLEIKGNIQYDFLYRSFADTPFYQDNFRQHTVRTFLNVTVKDRYPLRVNLVLRKSNSPYFKDFFDGGAVLDRFSYNRNLKQKLLDGIVLKFPEQNYLKETNSLIEKETKKYNSLKQQLNSKDLLQQLIEEREDTYFKSLQSPTGKFAEKDVSQTDSLKNKADSLKTSLEDRVEVRRKQLDSMHNKIQLIQRQADSARNKLEEKIASLRRKLNMISNPTELTKISEEYEVRDKKQGWEKFMEGLKTAGIGRSVINYSELTASNVSLTGINLEYNSGFYAAAAAGKIDYGFRDFFGRNTRSHNQYLVMGRIGAGNTEKRAVILSVYNGRKLNYGYIQSDTVNGTVFVTGYSIETIFKKNEETFISAEVAKSTRPVTGNLNQNKETGSLFHFSDMSNLGISVKGQTVISQTETRINGLFRKTGENFQSFSLFNYNTNQTAWMIRAEQPFLKKRIAITVTVRKNDFINPFTEKTFKTTTIFGSIQATARFRRLPVLSAGYYPGSQLYIIDRNRVRENIYYILNASAVHQYKLAGLRMVSSGIYNSYINKGTDSGFVNYAGKNYIVSQSVYLRQLQVQGNFIYTDQDELRFYTGEGDIYYSFPKLLRLGAGLKYNKILAGNTYWGGNGEILFDIPKIGSLQFQYEKSFLPTIQRTLFPVEIGRVTLIKTI